MSDIKHFPLKELFTSKRGNSKYTKEFCNKNKGDYEVYTGTTIGCFGKIKTYDYEGTNLTYTTDGEYAGTVAILSGKYNVGGHRAILIELNSNLYLEYFKFILQSILCKHKRSNSIPTLTWGIIENIMIPVPINKDGTFDLDTQKKIANQYEIIDMNKKILLEDKERLLKTLIDIDLSKYKCVNKEVQEIFDLSQSTNGSKFTKGFIKNNPGNIPVYGATRIEGEVGYGFVCNNAEIKEIKNGKEIIKKVRYFEDCLTYNIDGSAGFVFYRKGRFSLSEKVRPLIICDEYRNSLDEEYLKYIIQPIFRNNVRGRKGPNGQNEFTKISREIIKNLLVPIPINEDGSFDLNSQKEIANKYIKIQIIKSSLCKKIDSVLDIDLKNI
ncbi:restriction endonuclease subunit S [Clostridium botulinum]|nr:restriction endonuclease subunit S [Clostridium botulinum]NFN20817.1 restriction endonuclease subunit S [Clostridium botulinum]NFN42035.1 restriction endonuclease subunit S [Clostridium botulinum]